MFLAITISAGAAEPFEVLFFPDRALPCRHGAACKRKNCSYAHEPTNLTRLIFILSQAQRSLDICVFTITCDEISNAVMAAHQRGVKVRVVTDLQQSENLGSDIQKMRACGIEVRNDQDTFHMHHKYCVVDGCLLLNGSFNWTRQVREMVLLF